MQVGIPYGFAAAEEDLVDLACSHREVQFDMIHMGTF